MATMSASPAVEYTSATPSTSASSVARSAMRDGSAWISTNAANTAPTLVTDDPQSRWRHRLEGSDRALVGWKPGDEALLEDVTDEERLVVESQRPELGVLQAGRAGAAGGDGVCRPAALELGFGPELGHERLVARLPAPVGPRGAQLVHLLVGHGRPVDERVAGALVEEEIAREVRLIAVEQADRRDERGPRGVRGQDVVDRAEHEGRRRVEAVEERRDRGGDARHR